MTLNETKTHSKVAENITLSIVIPTYNEEKNIREVFDNIIAGVALCNISEFEVIIVDDGSVDSTAKIIQEIILRNDNVRVFTHSVNQGKGAALITGFNQSKMEWVLFTDADLQIDIKELNNFIQQTQNYEVVVGYRHIRGDNMLRKLFSKVYAILIRLLLGIKLKDINCPFKLFKGSFLSKINLESHGFFIDTEIMYLALSQMYHIRELGVTGCRRCHGVSSVKIWHVLETIQELLALKLKYCKLRKLR